MSYESFDNKHRKQKLIIAIWASIVITVLIALLIMLEGKRTYAIYKSAPFLDHEFLERDICSAGFNSIVKKGAVKSLVAEWYVIALKKENYGMIDFKVTKDSYRSIKMIDNRTCKIILKDGNTDGHGLRSFNVKLDQSKDYIFNYKVSLVSEVLLDDEDLKWR